MKTNWKRAKDLAKLISSAVDLILRDRYEVVSNKPLQLELGAEVGPGAARTTGEIERMLDKLFRMPEYYPPETAAAFSALGKEHTRQRLAQFLGLFVDVPVEADLALLELKEASWEDILIWIDSYITQGSYLERKIAEPVVKQREGFSSPEMREMERHFDNGAPGLFSLYTVRKYASEFKEGFSGTVRRAELLRLIPAGNNVPDYVAAYMEEASRCFIHGHFVASLILCRSAMEAAAKGRLRDKGYARELREIKQDPLKSVLNLALEKRLIDKIIWRAADDIRKMANKAAHPESAADEDDCMRAFDATRGILQQLYE